MGREEQTAVDNTIIWMDEGKGRVRGGRSQRGTLAFPELNALAQLETSVSGLI